MNEQDQKQIYDAKYLNGYRQSLNGYEVARFQALERFIPMAVAPDRPKRVLDYGAGNGLYHPLWMKLFPDAELFQCDISSSAQEKFQERFPDQQNGRYGLIRSGRAPFADGSFDLIVSVEVIEHVSDLEAYFLDIWRLLEPGGYFIWTTPCGNALSIEHLYAFFTGQIERSATGERRWHWEEPTHLRRLQSREIRASMRKSGFSDFIFRYRAHLFSFLCTYPMAKWPEKRKERIMGWDYRFFRLFPNAASMVARARKMEMPKVNQEGKDNSPLIETKTDTGQSDEKPPLAAVIIPCYNMGPYLEDAVRSASDQTYDNFELIVVDDGSDDSETKRVLKRLSHPRLRIVHQTNAGVAAARNYGISFTEAKYICCLDADDTLEPRYLAETVKRMEDDKQESDGFVTTWVKTFGNEQRVVRTGSYDVAKLCVDNQVHVASLFRRSAWLKIGGYRSLRGYQDWDFWLGLVQAGYRWSVIQEPLMNYRVRDGSMITNSDRIRPELIAEIVTARRSVFATVLPEIIAERERRLMNYHEAQRQLLHCRMQLAALRLAQGTAERRPFYCFGTGSFADVLLKYLDPDRFELLGYFDNNRSMQGTIHNGKAVRQPFWQPQAVLVASSFVKAICDELHRLGYHDEQIIIPPGGQEK